MPATKWGVDVGDPDRRDQLKLVYDYVKFHIGLYLTTPAALALLADGFDVKRSRLFLGGLMAAIAVFLIAGISAARFMSRHVNDPWQNDYLARFEAEAFSSRRRTMHHALYWLGLALGVLGLTTAVVKNRFWPSNPVLAVVRFDRMRLLETASQTSANVSIGDVNGDGHLDLVLAKGRHWPLVDRVLLGDGRGQFAPAYNLGDAADRSYSGLLADLDGDGDLDLVISNDAPDPKRVYLNDGKGHFSAGSIFGHGAWETRNASVADLDGDGLPDIIVANRPTIEANRPVSDASNYICLNRGQGRFDADCVAFSHEPATTITAADFNHDGLIDLAVPYRDRGQSFVYLNGGHAAFPSTRRVPFGPPDARIRTAETADLDGDGALDIVAIDEARGVHVYFGQKDGTFSSGVEIADGKVTPYALAVGDVNGDGRFDLVVGHVEAPSTIYVNDGSGRHYSPVQFGDARGTVYGFAIADLDGDGRLDIAVARSDAPNVVYFGDQSHKGP